MSVGRTQHAATETAMHSDDSTLLYVKNGAITYATVEQETDVGHPFVYS